MAQEWSDLYFEKILAYLKIGTADDRFVEILRKIQAAIEDKDDATADKWAKALTDLILIEPYSAPDHWKGNNLSKFEIVAEILNAIRVGTAMLDESGDPEFWQDLYDDPLDPNGNIDPRFDPNAGGVDVSLAEAADAELEEQQREFNEERAENLLHMMARNLDLIGDTRYDDELNRLINMALRNNPGLVRDAETLARRIAADRGMASGEATEGFVEQLRVNIADQALQAADVWAQGGGADYPNLGHTDSPFATDADESDDGSQGPDAGGAGGGSDGDSDGDSSDGGHGGGNWGGSDAGESSSGSDTPKAPPPSEDDPQDIEKIAEFLKDDREGAKALALRVAREMLESGRSTEPVGTIAKRLLTAAAALFRAERQRAEVANELPLNIWEDTRFQNLGMAFTQAYMRGDVSAARKALANALLLARHIASEQGLRMQITAERVLNNFLPAEQDRDFAGPDAELRDGLSEIDAVVRAHIQRQRQAAQAEGETTTVASEGTRQDDVNSDIGSTASGTPEGLEQFYLGDHIRDQMRLMLAALQDHDVRTARALAERLSARLVGASGRFGDMSANDILKLVVAKKRALDKANGVPDPVVSSKGRQAQEEDETETVGTGTDTVDVLRDMPRRDDDDASGGAGVVLDLPLVNKVDWDKFVQVYALSAEEIEALKDIATKIVKKGNDASPAVRAAKELLMRAKKAKTGAKFKNAIHILAAVEDVLILRADNKKLVKPMKVSDIPEDESVSV